jgi:hypothetical protein
MDKLIVGLSIVDQLDGETRTKAIAERLQDEAPVPVRRLRAAAAKALVALAAWLAPAEVRPADTDRPLTKATEA